MTPLKLLRYERGLTVLEVAQRTGLSRRTITNAEAGIGVMSAPTAHALARVYEVPVANVLGLDEVAA